MFIRASSLLFSVIALAGVAIASPMLDVRQSTNNECNTGSIQCCSSVQSSSEFINQILYSFGHPNPAPGMIGLTCSPITAGGSSSGTFCTSQPVCCNGNSFNGVTTACSPVTING